MTQALAFGVCLLAFLAAASATSRGPYCRQYHCNNSCPKGYKTDSYGCRTCECKDPCEDLPACDKSCPDGFKKNGDGCDICMCEQPVCEQPKAVGPCEAAIRSWYYNKYTQQCEKFFYGGCQGNDNRFSSKAECEETCPIVPVCEQPKKAGPCKAAFPRYYFNEYTQQCEHFIYGGCQANGNNFESKDDCEETCPVVPVCEQPKKVGPCRALIPRWYYSEAHRQCKPFSYGGCQANSNNFETKADCEETCDVDPCASLPQCTKTCRHGYKKNSDGCDICECVDPCDSLPPCTKTCQYGYKKNSYGCDICQCVVRVPVDKPGSCPRLPPRTVGTCVERCSGDRSCPGDQKCCSNGCGHVCKNPATPTTPRPAPSCPRYITASSSAWRNPCYSDNDCRGRYRCCQIGYSRRKSCVPGYSVRGPAY